MTDVSRPTAGQRNVWTVTFALLIGVAVVFNTGQTQVVVIRSASQDELVARAFDAGLRAGFGPRLHLDLRSLRIATSAGGPAQYCESVHYGLGYLAPALLVAVGEQAQICLARLPKARKTPVLVLGAGSSALMDNAATLMSQLPLATWAEALRSQIGQGQSYRVLYLAADSAAGRVEAAQFARLALPDVSIAIRLVATWAEWRAAVQSASGKTDLLVLGAGRTLLPLTPGVSEREQIAQTRAMFNAAIAATDVESVGHGAHWAIAVDPYTLGEQVALAGLAQLESGTALPARPANIRIAIDADSAATRPALPPLFEAVSRHQGLYLQRR